MDNVIPPLSAPPTNISGSEGGISGQINKLPEEIQNVVKPGQSYLLEILMAESSEGSTNLQGQINIGDKKIPLEVALETALKLPADKDSVMQVRISNLNDKGGADVKLLSVNGEKVINKTIRESLAEKSNSAALIIEVSSSDKASEFHPLKIMQLLKDITTKLHLPNSIDNLLEENFSKSEIDVKLHLEGGKSGVLIEGETIKNAVRRIELILQNFTDNIKNQKPQVSDVEHFIVQIKKELLSLQNTFMQGTAFSNPDSKLLALRTTLGNFLPEKTIKLENLSNVLLEISDVKINSGGLSEKLSELQSSRELTKNLPTIMDVLKDLLVTDKQQTNKPDNLFEIFKSLQNMGRDDLAQKIMHKFPSTEGKIMENMFRFINGASHHKPELWLGKDIFQELQLIGREGEEISSRINDFMSASVREGGNWKIINLPIMNGDQISRIRLSVKNMEEEEARRAKGKRKKSARFVVDTTFSRLGAFQFDGFSFVKDRQFDLIIRTEKVIDEDLKSNIFKIFKTTLNNLHYSGTIKINVKENFIKICEDDTKEETLKQGLYV